MVGATCSACGAVNPPGSAFCLRCGQWLPASGVPPPPPGYGAPPPGYVPPPPWAAPVPVGFTAAADGAGLDWVQLASLVSFVSSLVGPVLLYGVGPAVGYAPLGNLGQPSAVTGRGFDVVIAAALIGIGFGLVSLWLLRRGFGLLRPIDPRFSTPTSLIPVAMIGLVLLLIGLPLLLASFGPIVQCASQPMNQTTLTPSNCFGAAGAELGVGALLSGLGGILGLIGYIGMIIGLWRLGDRYSSSLLHAGAILAIFLPFVGWLLVYFGCREARRLVPPAVGGPPVFGAPPP